VNYLPNAAKLQPLGYKAVGFDLFGQRVYRSANARQLNVDCGKGRSETVTLSIGGRRLFTGTLPSEAFFNTLLEAVGWAGQADAETESLQYSPGFFGA
jgi:hypothetical protein